MALITLSDYCVNFNAENKYKQGIYKIYSKMSPEKIYIGSASGTSKYSGFAHRFNRHIRDLHSNKHCNAKLQRTFNKYGIHNIVMEIIEVCEPFKCIEREQYYIDTLNPYYNIARTAGNTLGVKPSLEQIIKMSKPVLQYSMDGLFIAEYINAKSASESTGINVSLIRQCCNESNNVARGGNFQWRYKKSEDYLMNIGGYKIPTAHEVSVYSKNGEYIKSFESILDASKKMNIPCGNISKHLHGKTRLCYGYVFKYGRDEKILESVAYEKMHKNQIRVRITNLDTGEVFSANSFREIDKLKIIRRGAISTRLSKGESSFVSKKKYLVELEKCFK
jgi:group I intron endonuclease